MEVIIGKWMKEQQETLKKEEERKKPYCTEECEKTALCLGSWN